MQTINFTLNEPVIVSLKDSTGDVVGNSVHYDTQDERTLMLPRHAAAKLEALKLEAGEEISITRSRNGSSGPAEWVVALTARSEQKRAEKEIKEAAELERKARQLAEQTRRDLPGQVAASIDAVRQVRPVRQMPKSAPAATQEPDAPLKGTGTYGPVPQVAYAGRKLKPEAVPFNVAFVEVTRFVVDGLKAVGEQWNDQAKQDAICSVLISASRQGLLGIWEREEARA